MDNLINGHEFVDLGLPSRTLWATCNIGAIKAEDLGEYYSWGEVKTKDEYIEETYIYTNLETDFCDRTFEFTKYNAEDGKTELEPSDDAASCQWGSSWKIPNKADFEELRDNCNWEWIEKEEVCGLLGHSKTNANSIFLPSAGIFYEDYKASWSEKEGHYWLSNVYEEAYTYRAEKFFFGKDAKLDTDGNDKCEGLTIRAISKKLCK